MVEEKDHKVFDKNRVPIMMDKVVVVVDKVVILMVDKEVKVDDRKKEEDGIQIELVDMKVM